MAPRETCSIFTANKADNPMLITGPHAVLSMDGRYRSWLQRTSLAPGTTVFVMLNPSTADATLDDPTIRRCLGYMRRSGHGRLIVVNLFTGRATKPSDLMKMDDPVGPGADDAIERAMRAVTDGDNVICGWGASLVGAPSWFREIYRQRVAAVISIAERFGVPLQALGLTADGSPRHPLYLRADAPLIPFKPTIASEAS